MMAKRPILKMNNFDNGDEIILKASEKETHYQGYAVYFKKHVTTVQAKGVNQQKKVVLQSIGSSPDIFIVLYCVCCTCFDLD